MPVDTEVRPVRPLVRYIDTWVCQHCKKAYTYMPSKCICKATDPAFKQISAPAPDGLRRTYKVLKSFLYGVEGHITAGEFVSLLKGDSVTLDLKRRGIIARHFTEEEKKAKQLKK